MSKKGSLLIELFGEEIPARMQLKAVEEAEALFTKAFSTHSLTYEAIDAAITPRRLCIRVIGLDLMQPDVSQERKGPRVDAPEKAIQGFLESTGLTLDQCEKRELDKGIFYVATIQTKGQSTESILPSIIEGVLETFSWPKTMRWSHGHKSWVRPVRSGVCILEGKTIAFDYSFGEGATFSFSAMTHGHRFMANQPIEVSDFEDYKKNLKQHFVILDHRERKAFIAQKASEIAIAKELTVVADDRLLDEVTGLVEWPVVLLGTIDESFMSLPPELLITVMKNHQKYFALQDSKGNLAPYFLVTANIEASDGGKALIEGNKRVLRARFSDALSLPWSPSLYGK